MDNALVGEVMVEVYSGQGSKVLSKEYQKETSHFITQIDLSAQPAGVYMILLKLDEIRAERKLIVE